jgi:hypothetical protein
VAPFTRTTAWRARRVISSRLPPPAANYGLLRFGRSALQVAYSLPRLSLPAWWFEERLLRGVQERAVKRCAAGHTPHGEHLQFRPFPGQIGDRFVPIDLRFHTPVVALRHKHFVDHQAAAFSTSRFLSPAVTSVGICEHDVCAGSSP